MAYVIKDVEGNFISPKATERGWYYLTYSGDTILIVKLDS
jgi:hypothetical protein